MHSNKDKKKFFERLANDLRSFGISVWYDEWSMKPGDRIRDKINEAICTCDYLLIVFSKHSRPIMLP